MGWSSIPNTVHGLSVTLVSKEESFAQVTMTQSLLPQYPKTFRQASRANAAVSTFPQTQTRRHHLSHTLDVRLFLSITLTDIFHLSPISHSRLQTFSQSSCTKSDKANPDNDYGAHQLPLLARPPVRRLRGRSASDKRCRRLVHLRQRGGWRPAISHPCGHH